MTYRVGDKCYRIPKKKVRRVSKVTPAILEHLGEVCALKKEGEWYGVLDGVFVMEVPFDKYVAENYEDARTLEE